MARSLRGDRLGRSGPEQFTVLLRGTAQDAEATAAETMRRATLFLHTARSRGR